MLVIVLYYENQVYDENYRHLRRVCTLSSMLGQMERLRYKEVSYMNALIYAELNHSLNINVPNENKKNKKMMCDRVIS
jgi:hypothetical protein